MPYLSQTSAISLIGSKAPTTVVPQVQFTKNGLLPFAMASATSRSNSAALIRPLQVEKKRTRIRNRTNGCAYYSVPRELGGEAVSMFHSPIVGGHVDYVVRAQAGNHTSAFHRIVALRERTNGTETEKRDNEVRSVSKGFKGQLKH